MNGRIRPIELHGLRRTAAHAPMPYPSYTGRHLQGRMAHARNLLIPEVRMDFQRLADKALQGIVPERDE